MQQQLYLYSCQALYVRKGKQTWGTKQIHLFFVDARGQQCTKVVTDYRPYLLLRCHDPGMTSEQVQEWVTSTNDEENKTVKDGNVSEEIVLVDTINLTPLMGFTNHRQDILFRIHYRELQRRRQVSQCVEKGCPGGPTILHADISDEIQFLHTTNWRLQRWYDVKATSTTMKISDMTLLPEDVLPCSIPPLTYAYVRIHALSSTATALNQYDPNHELPQDAVTACELVSYVLGQETTTKKTTYLQTSLLGEAKLLDEICQWFRHQNPCIIVHASDPFDHLAYLHFRMCRLWGKDHATFSSVQGTTCIENNRCDNTTGQWVFRDLQCPGREVVDLVRVLEKFMISPNLDGYTLLDAYRHPALLRNRDSVDYSIKTTTLPPLQRLPIENELMHLLQLDNSFLLNNLAFSQTCDLSLFHIVARGQQIRVFACFVRAYHENGIYINREAFAQRHLVVKRERKDSSYPDDPWLTNPSLESLRTEKRQEEEKEEEEDIVEPSPSKKQKRITVASLFGGQGLQAKKKTTVDNKKRFGGGFVISPEAGFYHAPEHAVVTLDFASLYPSIMKGSRLCTMRLVYDEKWLTDPDAELEYIPLDDHSCAVLVLKYNGKPVTTILDHIVFDVMQNRKRIRKKMIGVTDTFLLQTLDAQQLCAKILQNGVYGSTG
jgi:DNA polymerase elongation subunit (family B)